MSERVLITGGCGFVGSHLADAYLKRGYAVRVLDNLDATVHASRNTIPNYLCADVEFIRGDVRDTDTLVSSLEDVSIVSHQAAAVSVVQSMSNPSRFAEVNTLATAKLLELLTDRIRFPIRKLIVPSSMSIYGEGLYEQNGEPVTPDFRSNEQLEAKLWEIQSMGKVCQPVPTPENKPLQPTSIYAITKRDQEEMALSIGKAFGIPTIALRYFNIYGPRQSLSNPYTGVAAIFSSRLLNGNAPVVFEDGGQLRDFVHVSDVVEANMLATDSDTIEHGVYNIGSGSPISILEVAEKLIELFKFPGEPTITQTARPGDIRHCFADISEAREKLGYSPKADFSKSLEELIAWVSTQTATDNFDDAYRKLNLS